MWLFQKITRVNFGWCDPVLSTAYLFYQLCRGASSLALLSEFSPLLVFFCSFFPSFLPRSPLTPSHPSHLSASHPLSHLDFSPGATVCTCVYIHPVAVATAGGHISGWMNKRPGDPHPQRWREGEGETQNQISYVCIYF